MAQLETGWFSLADKVSPLSDARLWQILPGLIPLVLTIPYEGGPLNSPVFTQQIGTQKVTGHSQVQPGGCFIHGLGGWELTLGAQQIQHLQSSDEP